MTANSTALPTPHDKLGRRIDEAIAQSLVRGTRIEPLEVLLALGWLNRGLAGKWRNGAASSLQAAVNLPADKLVRVAKDVRANCLARGLVFVPGKLQRSGLTPQPLWILQDNATRGAADDDVEQLFAGVFVKSTLSDKQRARIAVTRTKDPDIEVLALPRVGTCSECRMPMPMGTLSLRTGNDAIDVCLACADLDHLVFLPSGDTTLTRRARQKRRLSAIVFEYNKRRPHFRRTGSLVESTALDEAEASMQGDAAERLAARQQAAVQRQVQDAVFRDEVARAIGVLFPRCDEESRRVIAAHASERGSGRVLRSKAGQALDEDMLTNAVIAHIRHIHTDYDAQLMRGVPRAEARSNISAAVERQLRAWR